MGHKQRAWSWNTSREHNAERSWSKSKALSGVAHKALSGGVVVGGAPWRLYPDTVKAGHYRNANGIITKLGVGYQGSNRVKKSTYKNIDLAHRA